MNKLCFGKNIVTRSLFSLFFDNISTKWNSCMPVTEGTSDATVEILDLGKTTGKLQHKVTSQFSCEFQNVCQS